MRHHIIDKSFVPSLRLDRGIGHGGVADDFVKMSEHVYAAEFEHGEHLLEIFLHHIAQVSVETVAEIFGEAFESSVTVEPDPFLIRNEMDGTEPEVER